jgi:hypothetical protein
MPPLRLGQLLFDFLSIKLSLFDSLPPLFQHGNDGPESEFLQDEINDNEQDELSQELGPLQTKCIKQVLHGEKAAQPKLRSDGSIVFHKDHDQGINRDRFRERHAQNRYG